MHVYPELEPARHGKIVIKRALALADAYGRIDIPDIPLGKPSVSSPVLSAYLASRGIDIIAHLRMPDHNLLSAKSIIKTLSYVGVRRMILLRGDLPRQGGICEGYWSPEEALAYAKKYGVEPGLLISPRRSIEDIVRRLGLRAEIYYITRFNKNILNKIYKIINIIKNINSKIGLYIVIGTLKNRVYLRENKIPHIPLSELAEILEWARAAGADRVILSAPGDGDILLDESIVEVVHGIERNR